MIIVLIISILGMLFAFENIYRRQWNKGLFVRFAFNQSYVYAGEEVKLTEIIENRKKMPVAPVEVRFRMKKGVEFHENENMAISDYIYKRDIYALVGNQKITRTLNMKCIKRGLYTIDDISVVTYPLLKGTTYGRNEQSDSQIYVYVKRTNVSDIMKACENLLGDKESNRKYLEDPFAFSSIREYTMQDPMKSINWKASAKTGGLMVNTYTSMINERMMIYLDVEDSGILKKTHLVDDSISVAATLYQKLLNKGTDVGICVNLLMDNKLLYLPPSKQKSNRTLLEQTLAVQWENDKVVDFEEITKLPSVDAIPIVISKNVSSKKAEKIGDYLGGSSKVIWVLPYERGEEAGDLESNVNADKFIFVKREVARE